MSSLLAKMKISWIITINNLLILASFMTIFSLFMSSLNEIKINGPHYTRLRNIADLTADIMPPPMFVVEAHLAVHKLEAAESPDAIQGFKNDLMRQEQELSARIEYWREREINPEVKDFLLSKVVPDAKNFFAVINQKLFPALVQRNQAAVTAAGSEIDTIYARHKDTIFQLNLMLQKIQADAETSVQTIEEQSLHNIYVLSYTTAGVVVLLGGLVFLCLRGMMREAYRHKQMLDELPVNVMVADPQTGIITYANNTTVNTLVPLETHLPVKAAQLVGTDCGIFLKDAAPLRAAIANAQLLPWKTQIKIGPETLALNVSAIRDAHGDYLAPMLTMTIITQQETIIQEFETGVAAAVSTVSKAATEMHSLADSMRLSSGKAVQLSAQVTSSATRVNTNVETVAAAAEELNASISEITRQVGTTAQLAQEAVTQTQRSNTTIAQLSAAAERIGNVTELISRVAEKTNLLALNATIEAARAGEAGKGFAVVAVEVKNLAGQTAKATAEIAAQISAIQSATQATVIDVQEIAQTITKISAIASSVATAAEEQGTATKEISRNIQAAATGTREVTQATETVTAASTETGNSSESVLRASVSVTAQFELMMQSVDKFLKIVKKA
ncbi:MAG: methyl-accepting chemotaxis protein [Alphaproteobacteria bacterium]